MGLVISKVQEGTPSVLLRCSLSIRWRFWGAKNGPGTKVSGLEAFEDTHGPRFQRSNVPPESLRLVSVDQFVCSVRSMASLSRLKNHALETSPEAIDSYYGEVTWNLRIDPWFPPFSSIFLTQLIGFVGSMLTCGGYAFIAP